ncbi:MAG: glycerophosphodiester phosphodiesterase [Lachnospiraceae bacterium]|nr:glycerophosphodiester phosphodiesterase [Lachnospiraceae bacterium]
MPLLYLFLIAPRMINKPDMERFYEYYYAHRGLHDNATEAPENSMAAFKKAVEAGYGMELDVQLTKDRVPVVFHDDTLERMCGKAGKVSDYTYEELQAFYLGKSREQIPKLEDVLQLVDGRTPLIVELKIKTADLSLCPVVDKLLSDYKGLYCIETFHPFGLWWYRIHRREVIRGQLSNAFMRENEYDGAFYYILQSLLLNFIGRPDFIAYNHLYSDVLSRRICCKWLGAVSVGWTIKSKEELERARKDFDLYIFEGFLI